MAKSKLITPETFSANVAGSKGRGIVYCDCSHLADDKLAILSRMIEASKDIFDLPVFVQTKDRLVVLDSSISIEKANEMYDAKYTTLEAASDALTIARLDQRGWNQQRLVELMKREEFIQTQPPHQVEIDRTKPHHPAKPPVTGRG